MENKMELIKTEEILNLFKVMIVDKNRVSETPVLNYLDRGLVLNFIPTDEEDALLKKYNKPLDIRTLFTKEERDNADPFDLIRKQILHYIEIYGLGMPGLFDLEVLEGKIITTNYVRGVTADEFADMVREILYENAPFDDTEALKEIIKTHNIDFDINLVKNNELRVGLFNVDKHTFDSGDDAVRYMCYATTGQLLLIKSKEMVEAMKAVEFLVEFFQRHVLPLAQVFNRHKKLILAAKNAKNKTVMNQISRLSKSNHIPIREHISKRFVVEALSNPSYDVGVLDKISLRDKFKFLNLLSYKKEKHRTDAFVIRNGKIHEEEGRKVWELKDIDRVEKDILNSLKNDLDFLNHENILLDPVVAYGLPISRKQTIGHLPFGTTVDVDENTISAGMYWENEWGAHDLDLSTIDENGNRTGWGQYSGYDRENPITFSGDITNAPHGAMEFMTSKDRDYGLFVNIFSGETGSKMELVIGTANKKQWMDNPVVRESHTLNSKGNIIGFIRDRKYTVYAGRLNNNRISSTSKSVVSRGMADFWTINRLFDQIGVKYDVDKDDEKVYDIDLNYEGFTYDKLHNILNCG
jgi:hypothetical protein